jgi:hypothetical protein
MLIKKTTMDALFRSVLPLSLQDVKREILSSSSKSELALNGTCRQKSRKSQPDPVVD